MLPLRKQVGLESLSENTAGNNGTARFLNFHVI
jgi:hypothetical protein